ncbi:phospholipid/cholesterol/gamma-HCH transport system ATP-binding protein [Prosthecobacter fusiformis]|uniref:Phospholipid/cholesterol/gamma-HCH transport system ATP-binding protein n=1 Tax=Prosthecobacter fusiformis TaxID=48464 RepID=A0A4R7RYQ8_9BACT|nr:ABC transporter ATP-binding protein [Prosthecobacter fusiformis]TDU70991.1 phospholipid/cholesterol/gamma-HCH transport system ATP-binding protein [Prosthecobacter fusiformis]
MKETAATPEVPFIRITGLRKTFGTQKTLQGVDLTIKHGETLVLIGPSGEGKSVLLKHIIGLLHPDEGRVELDGVDLCSLNERKLVKFRRRMGYLFQNAALFDSLTVAENVAFPLKEAGVTDRSDIDQQVHEALELVELVEHKNKMPINLSGGMRKRVGIARAIICRPECVLYDEPTAGLDPIVTDVIDQMIIRLQKRFRVTSIVITHDMSSVFKIADRVAMLKNGVISFLGTPDELRQSPNPDIQNFIGGHSGLRA